MRYDCEASGGTFVEFSDSWTRGEMKRFWELEGDGYWQLVLSKITNCQLAAADGVMLTKADLAIDRLDDIDYVVWCWLTNIVIVAVSDVAKLGEAAAASLWSTIATAAKAADDQPTP